MESSFCIPAKRYAPGLHGCSVSQITQKFVCITFLIFLLPNPHPPLLCLCAQIVLDGAAILFDGRLVSNADELTGPEGPAGAQGIQGIKGIFVNSSGGVLGFIRLRCAPVLCARV